MIAIGIDIGSLNTKVVIDDRGSIYTWIGPTGDDIENSSVLAIEKALEKAGLNGSQNRYIVATGIGSRADGTINEKKSVTTCLARGTNRLFPDARMVVDLGAETCTVVKLNERGRVSDWGNQDKCASGTGMFIQDMARLMKMSFEQMSRFSLEAREAAEITNTCAVFAESEVISHIHRDPPTPRENVVAGIFASAVSRIMVICRRVGIPAETVATGGVALNQGFVKRLEKEMGTKIRVPQEPQMAAALGAAIIASEKMGGSNK